MEAMADIHLDCQEARDLRHCIIKYDKGGLREEYESLWEEQKEGQKYDVKVTDMIGQQGFAAGVELPEIMESWYQVTDAAPHITLMI